MVVSELLLEVGLVLLIALLGWGNSIREFQGETRRIAHQYARRFGVKYNDVKSIVAKPEAEFADQDFVRAIKGIQRIVTKNPSTSSEHLRQLNGYGTVHQLFEQLKRSYERKYWLAMELMILCFVFGIPTYLTGILLGQSAVLEILSACFGLVPFVWAVRIVVHLIDSYKLELRFQQKMQSSSDEVED